MRLQHFKGCSVSHQGKETTEASCTNSTEGSGGRERFESAWMRGTTSFRLDPREKWKNGQESEKDPGDGSVRQRPRKHQPSTHIAITDWTNRGPGQHCNNAALMLTFVLDPTSTITTMLLHARTIRHVYSKISPMSPYITLYNLYNLYNRIYPRYTPVFCEALQRPKTWVTRQSGFDCIPSQHFAFWPTHAGQVFRRPLCPSLRYTTPRKKGLLSRVMFRVQGG